jgi:hypothetical protein
VGQTALHRVSQCGHPRGHRINDDNLRPERRAIFRSRSSRRRGPKAHIIWVGSAEVKTWVTTSGVGLCVRRLRNKMQNDVFVLNVQLPEAFGGVPVYFRYEF